MNPTLAPQLHHNSRSEMTLQKLHIVKFECLEVLKRYGFEPLVSEYDPYMVALRSNCYERSVLFGVLPSKESPGKTAERPVPEIARKELDNMTLECARIFSRLTPSSMHEDGALDTIRQTIITWLYVMGYADVSHLCKEPKPLWTSYKRWEKVAETDGVSNAGILAERKEAKQFDPVNYEE